MSLFNKAIEWLYLRQKDNLAYYDSLTGARTRLYYDRVLCKKYLNKRCYMFLFDIDDLKTTNDLYGHEVGSELIKHVSDNIRGVPWLNDVCRIGGDEFVAFACLDRIDFLELDIIEHVSYGFYEKKELDTMKDAMAHADKLMYKRKNKKKAKYEQKQYK